MTDERVAVITGAAQGIGRRTAEVLAAEGYQLAMMDRQEVQGLDGLSFVGDVSDAGDVDRFVVAVESAYGREDLLVNNAGIASIAPAEETTLEVWREVLDINLTGPFLLCRAFVPRLKGQGYGRIINLTSIMSHVALAQRTAYCLPAR